MHAAQVAAKRSGWARTALMGLIVCAAVALLIHYTPRYWAQYQIHARGLDGSHFETTPESEQRIRGSQLADAICGGRADHARLFLKAGYPVTGHSYETDMTALHCAAFRGDIPLMRELIERGSEVSAIAGENRLQPMHLAAAAAQLQAIELLKESGASINAGSNVGTPALVAFAVVIPDVLPSELWAQVRDKTSPAQRGTAANTLPPGVRSPADAGFLKQMIALGADLDGTNSHGESVLHLAALRGDAATVTEVLAQRFDANVMDAKGQTPLHAMVRVRAGISSKDKNAIIRALLDAGADVNARDQTGTNAFCAALPEPEVLATLLERGLDPNMAPSNGGDCWAGLQRYLSPTAIIRVAEMVPNLQTPHRPDGTPGAGPLFSFAQNTELDLVKYFLSRGLRPIDRGYNGYGVMHVALGSSGGAGNHAASCEVMIGLLLDAGANINERSDDGDTPLMAAIRQPASLIQLAVRRGADVNAVDPRTGESVLDHFVRVHNDEAIAALRAAGARAASEIRSLAR